VPNSSKHDEDPFSKFRIPNVETLVLCDWSSGCNSDTGVAADVYGAFPLFSYLRLIVLDLQAWPTYDENRRYAAVTAES
jgi:hypothetical protein